MNRFEEFFLENQWDLDAEAPRLLPARPPHECEHRWDRVIITMGSLNAFEPGFSCSRCGVERYDEPFDRQDFDTLHAERHGERKKQSKPRQQCSATTRRGHQCVHPCRPGRDMCQRHLKLSGASQNPTKSKCLGCATEIAHRRDAYHPLVLVRRPIFHVLWTGVKIRSEDYEEEYAVSDESFCSCECWLDHSHEVGTHSPDDAHP